MSTRPKAPAAERNKRPILDVIGRELASCGSVLEIGTGTGQQAVFFAAAMPWLTWQTSDLAECHPGIRSWIEAAGPPNVRLPILVDVQRADGIVGEYDAIFTANTAHIMSMAAVRSMFALAGRLLTGGGKFCLYGPINQGGEYTSDSNRRFDKCLRGQDPGMGIRHLEDLDELAGRASMHRERLYAMPANNALAVWRLARRDTNR